MAQTETQQIVSGQVYNVSYSADGRYLSYTQDAGNVGTLYVVDLTDPGFKRAIDSGAADSLATQPIQSQLSADGSFVLYDNYAANHSALFVRNLHTGTTSQITIDAAKYDDLVALGISADGRFIVYNAHSTGTGGIGNPSPSQDVTVVRDVTTGTETVVGPASPTDFSTDLTPDGHYLAVSVAGHVIVYDVRTGTTVSDRTIANVFAVRISDDGRYVAYSTFGDKAAAQVYLHDMQNPNAPDRIISTSAAGTTANDTSFLADFSGDGRHVLFSSSATNLGGASDTHYFLKDLDTGAVQPLTSGGLLSQDASTIINADGTSGLYVTTVLPPTSRSRAFRATTASMRPKKPRRSRSRVCPIRQARISPSPRRTARQAPRRTTGPGPPRCPAPAWRTGSIASPSRRQMISAIPALRPRRAFRWHGAVHRLIVNGAGSINATKLAAGARRAVRRDRADRDVHGRRPDDGQATVVTRQASRQSRRMEPYLRRLRFRGRPAQPLRQRCPTRPGTSRPRRSPSSRYECADDRHRVRRRRTMS